MKTFIKFLYLMLFIFFAITSKPLRLVGIYQQERFLQVAKEVGQKISSDQAICLAGKINSKAIELKEFITSQKVVDTSHQKVVLLTEEVNELVRELVAENTCSYIYRCFVWFT